MRRIVVTDPPRADAGDAETLGGHGVATVHEALGRVGYLGPEFRPVWPGARIGVDVVVDTSGKTPQVLRSGVRTACELFDGTAFPRA